MNLLSFAINVFKKPGKLPTHWKSEVPIKWKRNCITGALHRAKRISTDLEKDIKTLETSFNKAGYPKRFISHTINNFLTTHHKMTTLFRIFSSKNARKFSSSFRFAVKTKNSVKRLLQNSTSSLISISSLSSFIIKSLFNNKDKNTHRSKVVYKGDCSCGVDYIGETVRNLAVWIAEHSNPDHTSEPAKHLRENPSHSFTWRVLSSAETFHKRRIVEGLMIQQFRPSLNKQVIFLCFQTFPNGNYIRYIYMRAYGQTYGQTAENVWF